MTDANAPQPTADATSARTLVIIAYVLFLIGWPTAHLTTIAAVVLAYIQRDEVRGSVWESHYSNIIHTFWITLVIGIVAAPLCLILIGIPIEIVLAIWFLFRSIKGLVKAIDAMPYV